MPFVIICMQRERAKITKKSEEKEINERIKEDQFKLTTLNTDREVVDREQ